VFASDNLSSAAYATQEILHTLLFVGLVGAVAFDYVLPITFAMLGVLFVLVLSYRQTIKAYPSAGGAYVVTKDNLGVLPAQVAGVSLLIGYTLTVSVSVSAASAALYSMVDATYAWRVPIAVGFIAIIAFGNLRGVKESGRIFAVPTYAFVVAMFAMIGYGIYKAVFGSGLEPVELNAEQLHEAEGMAAVGWFLVLHAFASGGAAVTGVEAISNGVPAFKPPESKHAAQTLTLMSVILGTYFLGVSVLANHLKPVVSHEETIMSIMGAGVFGDGSPMYYILQFATFAILILAANTAYTGYPLLSSLIAKDGFLPRQLANRGDRLVFSNGILFLSLTAGALVVAFGGVVSALIPLYAVGVFAGFTISQVGMVQRHRTLKATGWKRGVVINVVGATATFIVLMVVIVSKFTIGAWLPVIVIPGVALVLWSIHRHYARVATELKIPDGYHARRHPHTVVLLVGNLHRGVLEAVAYARSLSPERLLAVTVAANEEDQNAAIERWAKYEVPVDLRVIFSPYRELTRPVLQFIDELDDEFPDDVVTVILPEFVFPHWWQEILHNQSALVLKARLRMRPNTVVTNVPIHIFDRPSRKLIEESTTGTPDERG
jgi:amino acid transporter